MTIHNSKKTRNKQRAQKNDEEERTQESLDTTHTYEENTTYNLKEKSKHQ